MHLFKDKEVGTIKSFVFTKFLRLSLFFIWCIGKIGYVCSFYCQIISTQFTRRNLRREDLAISVGHFLLNYAKLYIFSGPRSSLFSLIYWASFFTGSLPIIITRLPEVCTGIRAYVCSLLNPNFWIRFRAYFRHCLIGSLRQLRKLASIIPSVT